eukprot:gene24822-biopygen5962
MKCTRSILGTINVVEVEQLKRTDMSDASNVRASEAPGSHVQVERNAMSVLSGFPRTTGRTRPVRYPMDPLYPSCFYNGLPPRMAFLRAAPRAVPSAPLVAGLWFTA